MFHLQAQLHYVEPRALPLVVHLIPSFLYWLTQLKPVKQAHRVKSIITLHRCMRRSYLKCILINTFETSHTEHLNRPLTHCTVPTLGKYRGSIKSGSSKHYSTTAVVFEILEHAYHDDKRGLRTCSLPRLTLNSI